jgi:transcriptional regulator with XRE-family HTH domain
MSRIPQAHERIAIDRCIGRRIRELRLQLGLSRLALGEQLGVSAHQIQKYEKGINRISASTLHAAAGVLQVRVGYFFEDLPKSVSLHLPSP